MTHLLAVLVVEHKWGTKLAETRYWWKKNSPISQKGA